MFQPIKTCTVNELISQRVREMILIKQGKKIPCTQRHDKSRYSGKTCQTGILVEMYRDAVTENSFDRGVVITSTPEPGNASSLCTNVQTADVHLC